MIRVNLLPIRQARRRSAGKTQLFLFAGLIAVEILFLSVLYLIDSSNLSSIEDQVVQYEKDVKQAEQEVADAKELESRKAQLEKQLGILDQLEASRSGPVRMMDEFQAILSPPRNDEDRFEQTNKNWDVDWDPRRVWIEDLSETGGAFKLAGGAVDSNDVAEFLRRMISAKHFDDVELDVVKSKEDGNDGPRYVEFKIFGKILYNPKPKVVAPAAPAKTAPAKKPQPKKGT